jgi:hypothetical protein
MNPMIGMQVSVHTTSMQGNAIDLTMEDDDILPKDDTFADFDPDELLKSPLHDSIPRMNDEDDFCMFREGDDTNASDVPDSSGEFAEAYHQDQRSKRAKYRQDGTTKFQSHSPPSLAQQNTYNAEQAQVFTQQPVYSLRNGQSAFAAPESSRQSSSQTNAPDNRINASLMQEHQQLLQQYQNQKQQQFQQQLQREIDQREIDQLQGELDQLQREQTRQDNLQREQLQQQQIQQEQNQRRQIRREQLEQQQLYEQQIQQLYPASQQHENNR